MAYTIPSMGLDDAPAGNSIPKAPPPAPPAPTPPSVQPVESTGPSVTPGPEIHPYERPYVAFAKQLIERGMLTEGSPTFNDDAAHLAGEYATQVLGHPPEAAVRHAARMKVLLSRVDDYNAAANKGEGFSFTRATQNVLSSAANVGTQLGSGMRRLIPQSPISGLVPQAAVDQLPDMTDVVAQNKERKILAEASPSSATGAALAPLLAGPAGVALMVAQGSTSAAGNAIERSAEGEKVSIPQMVASTAIEGGINAAAPAIANRVIGTASRALPAFARGASALMPEAAGKVAGRVSQALPTGQAVADTVAPIMQSAIRGGAEGSVMNTAMAAGQGASSLAAGDPNASFDPLAAASDPTMIVIGALTHGGLKVGEAIDARKAEVQAARDRVVQADVAARQALDPNQPAAVARGTDLIDQRRIADEIAQQQQITEAANTRLQTAEQQRQQRQEQLAARTSEQGRAEEAQAAQEVYDAQVQKANPPVEADMELPFEPAPVEQRQPAEANAPEPTAKVLEAKARMDQATQEILRNPSRENHDALRRAYIDHKRAVAEQARGEAPMDTAGGEAPEYPGEPVAERETPSANPPPTPEAVHRQEIIRIRDELAAGRMSREEAIAASNKARETLTKAKETINAPPPTIPEEIQTPRRARRSSGVPERGVVGEPIRGEEGAQERGQEQTRGQVLEESQGQDQGRGPEKPVAGRGDGVPQPQVGPRGADTKAAPEIGGEKGLRAQLDQVPAHKANPGLTDTVLDIVRARAEAAGEHIDDYVNRRFQGVTVEDRAGTAQGAARFAADGRAIIRTFQGANPSTAIHEVLHVFRRDMTGADEAAAAEWAGAQQDAAGRYVWTRRAEERFARAGERYFHTGKAPTPKLQGLFDRAAAFIRKVYEAVQRSPVKKPVSDPVRATFDKLFTPKAEEAPKPPKGEAPPLGVENKRPDLAIPTERPDVRKAYVEERNQMEEPATRHQQELRDRVKQYFPQAVERIRGELLDLHRRGEAFSDIRQAEAQELLSHTLDKYGVGSPEFREASKIYNSAGNWAGAALAFRRDLMQTPEGRRMEAIAWATMPRPKSVREADGIQKQIDELFQQETALNRKGDAQRAAAVTRRITNLRKRLADIEAADAKQAAKDKEFYKRLGFDLDDPQASWVNNKYEYQQLLAQMNVRQEGWPAIIRETYMTMLHASGPVVAKKVLADVPGVFFYAGNKAIEGAIGDAKRLVGVGKANEASIREAIIAARSLAPALRQAAADLIHTWKTEQLPASLISPEDRLYAPSIPGRTGRMIRIAGFLLPVRAVDAFVKSTIAHMEVQAQAHRTAVDKAGDRLTGEEYAQHIFNEVNNPESVSWERARTEAMYRTYTTPAAGSTALNSLKYGASKTYLQSARKGLANFLLPIYGIPTNIVTQGLAKWTPGISELMTINRLASKLPEGETRGNQINQELAQAVMRYAVFLGAGWIAANGGITPEDDPLNPHAAVAGDRHFLLKHAAAPVRSVLAGADWFAPLSREGRKAAAHDGESIVRLERAAAGAKEMMMEAPALRLISDLIRTQVVPFTDEKGNTRYISAQDGMTKFAVNKMFDVSLRRQVMEASRDELRSTEKPAKNASYVSRIADYVRQKYTERTGKTRKVDGKLVEKEPASMLERTLSPLPPGVRFKK